MGHFYCKYCNVAYGSDSGLVSDLCSKYPSGATKGKHLFYSGDRNDDNALFLLKKLNKEQLIKELEQVSKEKEKAVSINRYENAAALKTLEAILTDFLG